MSFKLDDRVVITGGQHKGKTGKVWRPCTKVFSEYIRIKFDLGPRERTEKTAMIKTKYVAFDNEFLNQNKTQMSSKNTMPVVALTAIQIGKSNPRKVFDEEAIKELSESIKIKGVIQPILLRPTKKEGAYELVCGERRYRASLLAGKTDIPAYIRDLNDEEALEAQITENLQRKDVHPMEEAFAFKQLLEKHTVEEVAARVGKKDYFIRQRMKLNDLTEDWQKVFYKNAVQVSDALKIAAFPADVQKELYKQIGGRSSIQLDNWTINRMQGKLSTAPFDIKDTGLNKKMGACTACSFNSGFASLFPDSAANPICSNLGCFRTKCDNHFEKELKVALSDPSVIYVSDNYSIDKEVKARFDKEGQPVLNNNEYNELKPYGEMPVWEEFKEEYEEDYDTENELKDAFEREVKDYQDEQAGFEKKIASGKYHKAFVVDGNDKGKYTYVEVYKKGAAKQAKNSIASGQPTAADIDAEISRIRDRQKRNKELDGEKVHKRIIEAMKADKELKTLPGSFSVVDKVLMRFLISEYMNYNNKDLIKKVIGLTNSTYGGGTPEKLYQQLASLTDPQLSFLVRTIVFDKYNTTLSSNSSGGYMLRKLAESLGTIPIEAYETEQKEKAEKRQKNVDKRIAELQAQKKELKPKTEKPAAKAAPKKTAAKK